MRIRVKGVREQEPTERPPPGDRRGTVVVDAGRSNPPQLPVYVTRPTYRQMGEHARRGGAFEVGGFLLGGVHTWAGHRYLDVTTAVPALKARSAKTHLTFSNEAQREFHAGLARTPGVAVLGWYHTHPGYGVFLSDYDLFVQRSFFRQPHHVAVVIDPRQHTADDQVGVFVWDQDDVSEGYHLIVYEDER